MTELISSHEADVNAPVDACLARPSFSAERFAVFLPIFLTMIFGSGVLFICLADYQFGIQAAAIVFYTCAIVLYTFSANRGLPRYLFNCPVVRAQLPRLVRRHLVFLAVLFVVLTVALQLRSDLPASWLVASKGRRSESPFNLALFAFSALIALIQITTNRSVLARVHRDRGRS